MSRGRLKPTKVIARGTAACRNEAGTKLPGQPAQASAVLACMRQAGTDSFPENLPFEFGEDRQQASHGSTGGHRQTDGETKSTPRCSGAHLERNGLLVVGGDANVKTDAKLGFDLL
jgi:hypothetical protein